MTLLRLVKKQLKVLKEETEQLNEALGLTIAGILGIAALLKLSKDLYGPVKQAIEQKTEEIRERQKYEQISKGEAREEIEEEVVKNTIKELRANPATKKIVSTGSYKHRKDSKFKIQSAIDKMLKRLPYTPEDRRRIEAKVFAGLDESI